MNDNDKVILVDKSDNEIGSAEKLAAHAQGLLHRAFSIFVFRKKHGVLQLLLQQRQKDKYHCGGLWTNTCCSHPRLGETILQAADRRLDEEMGIKTALHQIGSFTYRAELSNGLIEHEYDHTLVGKYENDVINFNPEEVQDYKWVTLEDLDQQMQAQHNLFTPWFAAALAVVREKLDLTMRLLSIE